MVQGGGDTRAPARGKRLDLAKSEEVRARFTAILAWYHHLMTTATAQAFANIAFIKYRLAKLGRSNHTNNPRAKDFADRLFAQLFPQYVAGR